MAVTAEPVETLRLQTVEPLTPQTVAVAVLVLPGPQGLVGRVRLTPHQVIMAVAVLLPVALDRRAAAVLVVQTGSVALVALHQQIAAEHKPLAVAVAVTAVRMAALARHPAPAVLAVQITQATQAVSAVLLAATTVLRRFLVVAAAVVAPKNLEQEQGRPAVPVAMALIGQRPDETAAQPVLAAAAQVALAIQSLAGRAQEALAEISVAAEAEPYKAALLEVARVHLASSSSPTRRPRSRRSTRSPTRR